MSALNHHLWKQQIEFTVRMNVFCLPRTLAAIKPAGSFYKPLKIQQLTTMTKHNWFNICVFTTLLNVSLLIPKLLLFSTATFKSFTPHDSV